jgi:LysM repeat protein
MRIKTLLSLIIFIPFLFSCKASRHLAATEKNAPPSRTSFSKVEESYINAFRDIAVNEMKRAGIPASITLAQGMIESDYGRSRLAREANNHFGIKCHSDWTGQRIYHHDDSRDECFRKYTNAEESFRDHSEFLRTGSRYKFLFDLQSTDYKGWASGLKKAGYATNPHYASMLIQKIEEKNLHYYDTDYIPSAKQEVKNMPVIEAAPATVSRNSDITRPATPVNEKSAFVVRATRVQENNGLQYIIVKEGDTKEKIDEEFQLLPWELAKFNDLQGTYTILPGQILYLQHKRDKAEAGKETYTTTEGDTMYLISQKFGIKLKSLYKLNRVEEGYEPQPGTEIWLRSVRPAN